MENGILAFADGAQIIREGKLYPNANSQTDGDPAWAVYCKSRWGMSGAVVNDLIRAAPVLRRRGETVAAGNRLSVGAARRVASLDEAVQDAILDATTNRGCAVCSAAVPPGGPVSTRTSARAASRSSSAGSSQTRLRFPAA